jgi:hypothetical protein
MLIRTAAVALLMLSSSLAVSSNECSEELLNTTGCPTVTGAVTDTTVDLRGSQTPKTTPSSDVDDGAPDAPTDRLSDCANPASTTCLRPHVATVTNPITLNDIASFRPDPAVDHVEPNGWTVAGLDTNFFATGGSQVKNGTLLDQPASVRFTPVEWSWSYGDGAASSRPYPGASWAAQEAREFDPTGTSHVYTAYGTYDIDLDVDYAAEYRFAGGPWVPISGVLTVAANRLSITVGDAKTVLVERECTRNPAGPGC